METVLKTEMSVNTALPYSLSLLDLSKPGRVSAPCNHHNIKGSAGFSLSNLILSKDLKSQLRENFFTRSKIPLLVWIQNVLWTTTDPHLQVFKHTTKVTLLSEAAAILPYHKLMHPVVSGTMVPAQYVLSSWDTSRFFCWQLPYTTKPKGSSSPLVLIALFMKGPHCNTAFFSAASGSGLAWRNKGKLKPSFTISS